MSWPSGVMWDLGQSCCAWVYVLVVCVCVCVRVCERVCVCWRRTEVMLMALLLAMIAFSEAVTVCRVAQTRTKSRESFGSVILERGDVHSNDSEVEICNDSRLPASFCNGITGQFFSAY